MGKLIIKRKPVKVSQTITQNGSCVTVKTTTSSGGLSKTTTKHIHI